MTNSAEMLKIMKARTISDGKLLNSSAEYVFSNGSLILRISKFQWEQIKREREREIIKKLNFYLEFTREEDPKTKIRVNSELREEKALEDAEVNFYLIWRTGDGESDGKEILDLRLSHKPKEEFVEEYFRETVPSYIGFWPTRKEERESEERIWKIGKERAEKFLNDGYLELKSYSYNFITTGLFKVEDGKAIFTGQIPEDVKIILREAMNEREIKVEFIIKSA